MVLGGRPPGRVGRRRGNFLQQAGALRAWAFFAMGTSQAKYGGSMAKPARSGPARPSRGRNGRGAAAPAPPTKQVRSRVGGAVPSRRPKPAQQALSGSTEGSSGGGPVVTSARGRDRSRTRATSGDRSGTGAGTGRGRRRQAGAPATGGSAVRKPRAARRGASSGRAGSSRAGRGREPLRSSDPRPLATGGRHIAGSSEPGAAAASWRGRAGSEGRQPLAGAGPARRGHGGLAHLRGAAGPNATRKASYKPRASRRDQGGVVGRPGWGGVARRGASELRRFSAGVNGKASKVRPSAAGQVGEVLPGAAGGGRPAGSQAEAGIVEVDRRPARASALVEEGGGQAARAAASPGISHGHQGALAPERRRARRGLRLAPHRGAPFGQYGLSRAKGADEIPRGKLGARLAEAAEAYAADRYHDALKLLRGIVAQVPGSAAVRELLGLTYYRMGRWRLAVRELEASHELSGGYEQFPVIADCYRARAIPRRPP